MVWLLISLSSRFKQTNHVFLWGPVSWGPNPDFPLPLSFASLPAYPREAFLTPCMSDSLLGMLDFPVLVTGLGRLGFPSLSLGPLTILI